MTHKKVIKEFLYCLSLLIILNLSMEQLKSALKRKSGKIIINRESEMEDY